jgi:hypothetical protein
LKTGSGSCAARSSATSLRSARERVNAAFRRASAARRYRRAAAPLDRRSELGLRDQALDLRGLDGVRERTRRELRRHLEQRPRR